MLAVRIHWDCGYCGKPIEHRWEGDRLVFACKNSKHPHYFEKQITRLYPCKSRMLAWIIPIAGIAGIISLFT